MCDSCIPPALSRAEGCAAPGTPRPVYSTLALQPCPEPRSVRAPVSPLQCAVEHPKKDASPACPEPRRRERASRPKDLSANVRALECAVTENRPLTPLECAVTKKGGGRGTHAILPRHFLTSPRSRTTTYFVLRIGRRPLRKSPAYCEQGTANLRSLHGTRITGHHPLVLLRVLSLGATIGPYSASTGKQSRFFRCLREGERTAGSASARRRARNRKSCLGTSFYVGAQHAVPVRAMGIVG